ncbi:MAG: 2Fe-2S iron-sulfur cluster binding domain-containing protein [Candidatus Heimdallarchaeota archaeon]|nr:2Fe-2S iron-sulfur cluster binding domain-containing protein [Candidatus Heimdallarchaeota archaeon]
MPTIKVLLEEGDRSFDVPLGTRLVLALEDNGVDVSHRCGGNAKCTTCKCEITEGNPSKMTEAEKAKNVEGARLSCQILVEEDMTVKPLKRVKDASYDEPGKRPADYITPDPVWITV